MTSPKTEHWNGIPETLLAGNGYRRTLADMLRARLPVNERRIENAFLQDEQFCVAMPEADRESAARKLARQALEALM